MYFLRSILPFWLLAAFYLGTASSRAADLNAISGLPVQNGILTVGFAGNPGVYYLLEHSHDLANWAPADMSLCIDSVLDLAPGVTKGFFRAVPYSKFSPQDTDGDGIDDIYELTHSSVLDPLDPSDGSHVATGTTTISLWIYLAIYRTDDQ
ncbi:MAG: hypothetical protein IPK32_23170 [Verrucomicrobiaceae bacterium]|nr:hypothetical protein [Verrucomicrobiaceae bacterium]